MMEIRLRAPRSAQADRRLGPHPGIEVALAQDLLAPDQPVRPRVRKARPQDRRVRLHRGQREVVLVQAAQRDRPNHRDRVARALQVRRVQKAPVRPDGHRILRGPDVRPAPVAGHPDHRQAPAVGHLVHQRVQAADHPAHLLPAGLPVRRVRRVGLQDPVLQEVLLVRVIDLALLVIVSFFDPYLFARSLGGQGQRTAKKTLIAMSTKH